MVIVQKSIFATNLNKWAVISLRTVEYVTIDNFQIQATGLAYGVGISLSDNANYNTISNNDIEITTGVNWILRSSGISAAGYNSLNSNGSHANHCTIRKQHHSWNQCHFWPLSWYTFLLPTPMVLVALITS